MGPHGYFWELEIENVKIRSKDDGVCRRRRLAVGWPDQGWCDREVGGREGPGPAPLSSL